MKKKKKNPFFLKNPPPPPPLKSCRLWGSVQRYCRAGQATDDNRANCMLDTEGYTHAHRICDIYCFSTAVTVTQRRLHVTSYAHCLSCYFVLVPCFLGLTGPSVNCPIPPCPPLSDSPCLFFFGKVWHKIDAESISCWMESDPVWHLLFFYVKANRIYMIGSCHNKACVIKINVLKRPILFGITKKTSDTTEGRKDKSFEQEGLHVLKMKLKTHLT